MITAVEPAPNEASPPWCCYSPEELAILDVVSKTRTPSGTVAPL